MVINPTTRGQIWATRKTSNKEILATAMCKTPKIFTNLVKKELNSKEILLKDIKQDKTSFAIDAMRTS